MLNLLGPEGDMGVIVARFQTPFLTDGHRELIETVRSRHKKFAIVLGIAKVIPSRKNPLDYATRVRMIQDAFPGVEILAVHDTRSDKQWSQQLDSTLRKLHPHEKIILYGSRDSFIRHYSGKFATAELDEVEGINATAARKEAFHEIRASEDFRRGVMYAVANQYPKNVLCVDVAVVQKGKAFQVLLGSRTEDEGKWRFFGGHVNVGSETLEAAGRREAGEESGVSVGAMEYIGSTPIKDPRYDGTGDGIFTVFFVGHYHFGPVQAGDDIDEVKWFQVVDLNENMIVPEHHVLFDMFMKWAGLRGEDNRAVNDGEAYEYKNYRFDQQAGKKVYVDPIPAEKVNWDK